MAAQTACFYRRKGWKPRRVNTMWFHGYCFRTDSATASGKSIAGVNSSSKSARQLGDRAVSVSIPQYFCPIAHRTLLCFHRPTQSTSVPCPWKFQVRKNTTKHLPNLTLAHELSPRKWELRSTKDPFKVAERARCSEHSRVCTQRRCNSCVLSTAALLSFRPPGLTCQ